MLPRPPRPVFGGFWHRPRPVVVTPGYGYGGGCGSGCFGGSLAVVVTVFIILALLSSAFTSCSSGRYGSHYNDSYEAQESSSTVREKLPADAVTKTDYYTDADGDWIHSASRLTEGLEGFYDRTGVQPYVYILPNGTSTSADELTSQAEQLYDELFSDEGHFLLVFCDDGSGGFTCGYVVGTTASAVMDSEAIDVLADELDYAYNNAETDEEVFSDAFSATADRIMAAAEEEEQEQRTGLVVGVGVGTVAVIVVVYLIVLKRRERIAEEKQRMEDILSTPLERFGDKDVEDLADKYEDKD